MKIISAKALILLIWLFVLYFHTYAQQGITNAVAVQLDDTLKITYDLPERLQNNTFFIRLQIIMSKNGETVVITPKHPWGDVGGSIKGGIGKTIYWLPLQDSVEIVGSDFQLKIVAEVVGQSKDIEFVRIQGGTFEMGSNSAENALEGKYVHRVNLNDFEMGKYEVTNYQYLEFLTSYGSNVVKEGEDCGEKLFEYSPKGIRMISGTVSNQSFVVEPAYMFYPANNITWFGAREFCKYYGYRLPSEAEWEFAARERGKKVKYGNGQNVASHSEIYFLELELKKDGASQNQDPVLTSPVCSYKPNSLELFDMSGNVWEWCQDWYSDKYYLNSKTDNPPGPAFGHYKVIRGGSWYSSVAGLETYRRNFLSPSKAKFDVGFRVVREILNNK